MKRSFRLSIFAVSFMILLAACSSEQESDTSEIPEITEQVAEDVVADYDVLSYKELEVLAYEGDADAQYQVAQMLEYGTDDVSQNFTEAIEWYKAAAEQSMPEAMCALGYFYLTGTGVDVDLQTAYMYFYRAIEAGSINAKVGLGRTYLALLTEDELNTEEESLEDTDDALNSDETTVDDSTDSDISESGEDEISLVEYYQTIQTDKTAEDVRLICSEAYALFRAAYSANDVDGIYYTGYCLENGIGVDQDLVKANTCYEKAVATEETAIQYQYSINMSNVALGLNFLNGHGAAKDTEVALEFLTAASDNGFPQAQYYLGQVYEKGLGVDRDYEQAMEYYMMAAESDYAPAENQIGYLYYNGYGVDVDFSSAVYYQKLAALQGYAPAQVNLGFLYENGYGVERNLNTALSYYEMAAESGYEGAMEAVVRVRAQINEET